LKDITSLFIRQHRLRNDADLFAVLFVNAGTPMKIGTPKNWGPENSDSSALGQLLRENEKDYGKTKPIGITTISRLSSHQVWLDLAQGHPSYMGLISCVFWPVAHGAVLQSHMEWKGMALSSSKCRRIIQTDGFLDCDAHARFGFYYIFYFA